MILSLRIFVQHCVCSTLLVVTSTIYSYSQSLITPEYQLKAVFLFNFTQFVEWPPTCFSSDQDPMVIGILGKDPFGTYLNEIVSGEKVNGHPLVIQHYNDPSEIKTCHILYISKTQTDHLEKIAADLKSKNILMVSDDSDFLTKGGMIRFYNYNNKIQLQINLESTKQANLVISSKLLRLAQIVSNN